MAKKCTNDEPEGRASAGDQPSPPGGAKRLRLRLNTVDDVKKELARLYRDARAGQLETHDASRMANMLAILGRIIEGADIEERMEALERTISENSPKERGPWASPGH